MSRARTGLIAAVLVLAGCQRDMHDQQKYTPYAAASFPQGQSALAPPEGTVAHDAELGAPAASVPPLTEALMTRGRERFDIFCSPCHGRIGDGNGMIVQRGFPHPPSFHTDRLRAAPDGHFFDVISHGFGAMYSYGSRIETADRRAIIAYVRALQLSQHATADDLGQTQAGDAR